MYISKNDNIELVTLHEVSNILDSSLDLHKTMRNVLNTLSSYLQMQRGIVALLQQDHHLQVVAATGMDQDEIAQGRVKAGEGVMGSIFKAGIPAIIPHISREALFLNRTGLRKAKNKSIISFIGVPIMAGRKIIGLLGFDRESDDQQGISSFGRDARFLSIIANLTGQTVSLYQKMVRGRTNLMHEQQRPQPELHDQYNIDNVIGQSKIMQSVFAEVHQVAPSKPTVLFLDKIGDVSPGFQTKLLRVPHEREFKGMGGNKTTRVHVRLVGAADHRRYAQTDGLYNLQI